MTNLLPSLSSRLWNKHVEATVTANTLTLNATGVWKNTDTLVGVQPSHTYKVTASNPNGGVVYGVPFDSNKNPLNGGNPVFYSTNSVVDLTFTTDANTRFIRFVLSSG